MESDTESHAMIEGFRVTSRSTPEWLPASTAAVGFQIAVRAGDEWRSARIARVRPAGGVSEHLLRFEDGRVAVSYTHLTLPTKA